MSKSNKNSSSEDDIGLLHSIITKCHTLKSKSMLEAAKELMYEGYTAEEIAIAINSRDLMSAQKWVEYNQVGCLVAEDDETSELSKDLKKLKSIQSGKIVDFKDLSKEA